MGLVQFTTTAMLTGSNKHVSSLAIVIGVCCFLAVVLINAKYESEEALAHEHELEASTHPIEKDPWLAAMRGPDCDANKDGYEECMTKHEDDDQLEKDTEADDVKDGESVPGEKKTENKMAKVAEEDHVSVDHEVDKIQKREVFDLAYHAAMVKKRQAKAAAAARKALAAKLAKMKKDKRTAVLEKIDCNELKKIYVHAQPHQKKYFQSVNCDSKVEILP